ncbi:hypothetical protein C0992_005247, partial [Termitomyces sp. T32_za158]
MVYERIVHEDSTSSKTLAFVSKDNNTFSGSKSDSKKSKSKSKKKREPKPDDICHNCGDKGHWSLKCPKPKKAKALGNANISISDRKDQTHEVGKVLMALNNGLPPGLLLDSTATCHMIADRIYFTEYCDVKNQHISVGGLNKLSVAGI